MKGIMSEVPARYARALLEVAAERKLSPKALLAEIQLIEQVTQDSSRLYRFLSNPAFSVKTKQSLLDSVLSKAISPVLLDLLKLLVEKRRETALIPVMRKAKEMLHDAIGIVEVKMTSAMPLDDADLAKLKKRLARVLARQVILDVKVDSSLLGGIVFCYDGRLIDGSCRGQLEQIRFQLMQS